MKNVIKGILMMILVVLFAISMAGFWKYKLRGTKYIIETGTDSGAEEMAGSEEVTPEREYADLTSDDLKNEEKVFITDINKEDDDTYTIKGLIYEQCEITKDEYNKLKTGKETVTILGKEYEKDKIKSNNIILKEKSDESEESENSKEIYIKYDSTSKKYLVKDSATDYTIYNQNEKYVKYNTQGTTSVTIKEGTKTEKKKVSDIEADYKGVEITEENAKLDLASFTFNKKGICTDIKIDKK